MPYFMLIIILSGYTDKIFFYHDVNGFTIGRKDELNEIKSANHG